MPQVRRCLRSWWPPGRYFLGRLCRRRSPTTSDRQKKTKKNRLQSLLRAGEREMAKLQATIDDARAAVGGGGKDGGAGGRAPSSSSSSSHNHSALGAEDDTGAAAAEVAGAARRAAAGVWREVAALDARIAAVLHALGEAERLKRG